MFFHPFPSVRVDCECKRPSFLATVFVWTSAFNGDLSKWDVAKVTSMSESKFISILEKVSGLCFRCLDYVLGV